jgi:hypothetical protein
MQDDYLQLPLVARVALEAAQSFDNAGKIPEAYAQVRAIHAIRTTCGACSYCAKDGCLALPLRVCSCACVLACLRAC